MKQIEWAENYRRLREEVEREFEHVSVDQLFPNPKRYVIEVEFRHRQAIMDRHRSEQALIFGEQATPIFALIGMLLSLVGGIVLVLSIYDWLGGGWRGGTWTIGLLILAGWLLEYGDRTPRPSFWDFVIIATAGILVLLGAIGLATLAVALIEKLKT